MPRYIPYSAVELPPSNPKTFPPGEGRTRQEDLESSNINNIMAQYQQTGILPTTNREAFFADVTQMGSYREAITQIHDATDAFMQLPPSLRTKFDNDPAKFLDFTANPENRSELVKMGLIEDPSVEKTNPPPVVEAAPAGEQPPEAEPAKPVPPTPAEPATPPPTPQA